MLTPPTEFPFPGSIAFLAPDGREVRVIQRKGADQLLVALLPLPSERPGASTNPAVPLADCHATRAEAQAILARPKSRANRGRAA